MRATNAILRLREQFGDAAATDALAPSPRYPQGDMSPLPRTSSDPTTQNFARVLPGYPGGALDYGRSPAQIAPSQIAPNSERIGGLRGGDALPVWQTRLHGMRDFAVTLSYEPGEFDFAPYTLVPPFVVPAGYLAIVRRYRFLIEPPVVAVTPGRAQLTFMLDGQPVPFMSGIPVESFMPDYSEMWLEANAFQEIGAQLSVVDAGGAPVALGLVRIMVMLYGELRRPGPYAPANTCCYDDLPPPLPLPLPAPAPIVVSRNEPARQLPPPKAQPSSKPPERSLPSPTPPPPPTAKASLPVWRRGKR